MMLVVNHTTSFDNLFLHYVNTGSQNITVSAILVQDQIFCDVQFLCEICFENCVSKAQSNCTSNSLRPGPVTVIIQANGNNLQLLLVSINSYYLHVCETFLQIRIMSWQYQMHFKVLLICALILLI